MDPLTITTAALTISARCLTTAKTVYALRTKFKNAQVTISAIHSESTVIGASLGHLQNLVLKDPETLRSNFASRPELESAFDTALTGCALVYSVLDDEVKKLLGDDNGSSRAAGLKCVWKEDTMKELLQQIRGQQSALSLLIQGLQLYAIFYQLSAVIISPCI
jgi:hypothetical protein